MCRSKHLKAPCVLHFHSFFLCHELLRKTFCVGLQQEHPRTWHDWWLFFPSSGWLNLKNKHYRLVHFDPCRCIGFELWPSTHLEDFQQSRTGSRSREAKNRVAPFLGIDPICLSHFSMPGYETSQDRSDLQICRTVMSPLLCSDLAYSCPISATTVLPSVSFWSTSSAYHTPWSATHQKDPKRLFQHTMKYDFRI